MRAPHKRGGQTAVLVLGVMAVIVLAADPAAAHYVYDEVNTYQTDSQCVTVRSETSHGSYGAGYAKARTESTQDLPIWGLDCRYDKSKPMGWIWARFDYYRYSAAQQTWFFCASVGWTSNQSTSIDHVVSRTFGPSVPCGGASSFGTSSFGAVYDNGAYQPTNYASIGIWSGSHALP